MSKYKLSRKENKSLALDKINIDDGDQSVSILFHILKLIIFALVLSFAFNASVYATP